MKGKKVKEESSKNNGSKGKKKIKDLRMTRQLDPVREQKKKDKPKPPKKEVAPVISMPVTPSFGTRLALQNIALQIDCKNEHELQKYTMPEDILKYNKKKKEAIQKKNAEAIKKDIPFCAPKFPDAVNVNLPQPIAQVTMSKKFEAPSPESSHAKVALKKATPTPSTAFPEPPTPSVLDSSKPPKSGITLNETETEVPEYDSFNLVYKKQHRPNVTESKALYDISERDEQTSERTPKSIEEGRGDKSEKSGPENTVNTEGGKSTRTGVTLDSGVGTTMGTTKGTTLGGTTMDGRSQAGTTQGGTTQGETTKGGTTQGATTLNKTPDGTNATKGTQDQDERFEDSFQRGAASKLQSTRLPKDIEKDLQKGKKTKVKKKSSQMSAKGDQVPIKKTKKTKKNKAEKELTDAVDEAMNEILAATGAPGGDEENWESYLTKQFRKKVSQHSKATSYQERDIAPCPFKEMSDAQLHGVQKLPEFTQKFKTDSEMDRAEKPKRKFRRGTLESHSFTDIVQHYIRDFYFGTKGGTMHQGDPSLDSENMQGICMPVAAYCYAMLKHPTTWEPEDVDDVLVSGTNLYKTSLANAHIYVNKPIEIEELDKFCFIGEEKIRFIVDVPEVSGYIFSEDKTIFNLTKALTIFFARQRAGILISKDTSIGLWRDKYYFMFDARPRTKDMYSTENGTAHVANFYDVDSLVTVLLLRSGWTNTPFVIHSMRVIKVMHRHIDYKTDECDFEDSRSNYNLLSEVKAVALGTYHLGDLCFGFTRNKQALCCCVIALVYSRITPSSAWHRSTLDKIMVIGDKLCSECLKCDAINVVNLDNLPALLTIGPYMVEIFIHPDRFTDCIYKKCRCLFKVSIEDFFANSTNSIVQIGPTTLAVWKQRNMYFCFDPYCRNKEGLATRFGASCVSMHANTDSLVQTILANFDPKELCFTLHALKVCKIARDPAQNTTFPKSLQLTQISVDDLKNKTVIKGSKKATRKKVTVDFSEMAKKCDFENCDGRYSLYAMGSKVESLEIDQLPSIPSKKRFKELAIESYPHFPPLSDSPIQLPSHLVHANYEIINLDSPSLSETQIPPKPLEDSEDDEKELEFMDLCSFDLTIDEIEQEPDFDQESVEGGEKVEGEAKREYKSKMGKDEDGEFDEDDDKEYDVEEGDKEIVKPKKKERDPCEELEMMLRGELPLEVAEGEGGEGEEPEEEWYYTTQKMAQVGSHSLDIQYVSKMEGMVNTDITYFPIEPTICYPTHIKGRQEMQRRMEARLRAADDWEPYVPKEPDVTMSEELLKPTNFVELPDDSQIIRGTRNLIEFDSNIEFMAPFACIMAATVSKKYTISSWSSEVVDYILTCGHELYKNFRLRYDQVSKLEIPKISLGSTDYRVLVSYIFDSYMKENILEVAFEKVLFVRSNVGILVTPTYACTIISKNHLYYLFDPFGNNEVGLSEGPANTGTACFSRFKNLQSVAERVLYNKRKRELDEGVEYSRFVLSAVKVKAIPREDEEPRKKKKKPKIHETGEDGVNEMDLEDADLEEDEEEAEEEPEKKEKKEKEVKVGYQFKNGMYLIEGSSAMEDRNAVTGELKQDHFICLCACLMLLNLPVKKWDNKKVDKAIENGVHVYLHAEDLEISEKRSIKNVLIGKFFFDVVVKKINIESWVANRHLGDGINFLLGKKMNYIMIQFPNACYVVHKSEQDGYFHLFDPYGPPKSKGGDANNAGWIRCKDLATLKLRLKKIINKDFANYAFYNFEVTSIRKAPKELILSQKLRMYDVDKKLRSESIGKPFYEDVEWLKTDPIPWSRIKAMTADGKHHYGSKDNRWHLWDIDYPNDLFSMMGDIHEASEGFPEETRGKQTLANLVCSIAMFHIYDMEEWNPAVINSILVNGDNYFQESSQDIKDENYDFTIDDLKNDCTIFPYQVKVNFDPVIQGTMFLVRLTQFNLYKALRYFFDKHNSRFGIISAWREGVVKHVSFGKVKNSEYFMFDSSTIGYPMFNEFLGVAYCLRMTTLNRLIHVLALTLRGGDFFVSEVEVVDLQPIN